MNKIITIIFLIMTAILNSFYPQQLFFRDIFKGGVSIRMFNSLYSSSSSTYINFPNNSKIRKAFLICGNMQFNDTLPITVKINGLPITFNNYSKQTNDFIAINQNLYCNTQVIDITDIADTGVNIYTLDIPTLNEAIPIQETNKNLRFIEYTLIVEYENANLPIISSNIYLNNIDISESINYNFNNLPPINTNFPTALSLLMSAMMQLTFDGSYIYINNDSIGLVGSTYEHTYWYPQSNEIIGASSGGILGQYDYYSNTIIGIGDDTPSVFMDSTDVLANISNSLQGQANSFLLTSIYQGYQDNHPQGLTKGVTNPIWATFLTYSTKCDTLKSYLTTSDTTICEGEPLVLQVGGLDSYSYAWRYRGEVISNDTALSIVPEHNMLYSILVSDTSGCSKTEIINIKVNPKPSFVTTVNNATCPNNNGSIVLDSLLGVAPPFRYRKDNETWQTAPVYGYLAQGSYNISMLDSNGCIATQSVNIESINNSIANFSFANSLPFIPTEVVFENQSQNTSVYQWQVNGTTIDNTENLAYLFEQSGSYEITLIASLQNGVCADTTTKTITLNSENYFYIPTTFNGEIILFSNGYQSVSFSLVNALGQQVFSKTLAIHNSEQLILNNLKIAKGVYFYQAEAIKNNGEVVVFGGKILF